jgi:hypothetical protein
VSSPAAPAAPAAPGVSSLVVSPAPGVSSPGLVPRPGETTVEVSPSGTASGSAPVQFTGAANQDLVKVSQSLFVGMAGMLLAWL